MQLVLQYVPDDDAVVAILKNAKVALTTSAEGAEEAGVLVVKETVADAHQLFYVNRVDNSLFRSSMHLHTLFVRANLTLLMQKTQRFTEVHGVMTVKMFALR